MGYSLAYVDANTPETLEYGNYRGWVVLDENGVCVQALNDKQHGMDWLSRELGKPIDHIKLVRAYSEEYREQWDVED